MLNTEEVNQELVLKNEDKIPPTLIITDFHKGVIEERVSSYLLEDYVFTTLLDINQKIEVINTTLRMIQKVALNDQAPQSNDDTEYLKTMLLWIGGIEALIKIAAHPCPQNRSTESPYVGYGSEGTNIEDGEIFVYSEPFGHSGGIAKEQQGLFSFTNYFADAGKLAQILRCHPGMTRKDEIGSNLRFDNLEVDKNNHASRQAVINCITSALKRSAIEMQRQSIATMPEKRPSILWLLLNAIKQGEQAASEKLVELSIADIKPHLGDKAEAGPDKGKTVLWLLMFAVVSGRQAALEKLAELSIDDIKPYFGDKSEDGIHTGQTVLWWLMAAAATGKQAALEKLVELSIADIQLRLGDKAEAGPDKGKIVLWLLMFAVKNGNQVAIKKFNELDVEGKLQADTYFKIATEQGLVKAQKFLTNSVLSAEYRMPASLFNSFVPLAYGCFPPPNMEFDEITRTTKLCLKN